MARQSDPLTAIPVLVTRPRDDGETFARALLARFGARVRPVVAPLIAPRYLTPPMPAGDFAAVIFTSAQAVEGARRLGVPLPRLAWCVGTKTAAAATAAGFKATSADGAAEDLLKAILSNPPCGRLLYLRGVDTRGNLLERLNASGVHTDCATVYTQDPQRISQEALDLLRAPRPVLVPLFSPRTAGLFRSALPPDRRAPLHIAAMSASFADVLADLPRVALVIAPRPDARGMLDAVESLLADLPPA